MLHRMPCVATDIEDCVVDDCLLSLVCHSRLSWLESSVGLHIKCADISVEELNKPCFLCIYDSWVY